MTIRGRRHARLVAVVVALAMLGLVLLPLLAVARPLEEPAPADVVAAFGDDAGPVRPVLLWSTAFLRDAPDADPVVPADQWVAPVVIAGTAVGTRTVWRDPAQDGTAVLAAESTDADLAGALVTLAPGERLVSDRGELLALSADAVRSLVPDRTGTAPAAVPLAEYRAARAAEFAATLDAAPDAGGAATEDLGPLDPGAAEQADGAPSTPSDDGASGPVGGALAGLAGLAGAALLVALAVRRRRPAWNEDDVDHVDH